MLALQRQNASRALENKRRPQLHEIPKIPTIESACSKKRAMQSSTAIEAHHPLRHVALGEHDANGRNDGHQGPAQPHRAIVHGDGCVEHGEVGRRGTGVCRHSRVRRRLLNPGRRKLTLSSYHHRWSRLCSHAGGYTDKRCESLKRRYVSKVRISRKIMRSSGKRRKDTEEGSMELTLSRETCRQYH